MTKESKAALIGATATIIAAVIAAIIGGIFVSRDASGSSSGVPNISTTATVHDRATLSGNNAVIPFTMNRMNPSNGATGSTSYTATLIRDSQSGFWVIDSIQ